MHNIQAAMQLSRQDNILAYGMVTIDHSIRFMVQLRKYTFESGEEKMVLHYPRKEKNGVWNDAVRPSEGLEEEIKKAVISAVKDEIKRDLHLPEIEEVIIIPEYVAKEKKIRICATASVKICGLWIDGITVKQGEKGMFINMPQYRQADGKYRDLVYAITRELQDKISTAVITEYKAQNGEEEN